VSACRLGVLALGDSITNGGGELQWGVALQSWALWVARGLGLPYTPHAADGARVTDVVATQLPAVAGERYDLGCLYIGVNDVRGLEWDRASFERDHTTALAFLAGRCDRVLTATVPLDLGGPRTGGRVGGVEAAIEASALRAGALVLDLRGFGGRGVLMADHVHPTAFGQIAIAEAALDLLAADGMTVRVRPSSLIDYETTRVGRLRGDLTYAYRHTKVSARAVALSVRRRVGASLGRRRAA
jgi:lysophospholipase L1-like esterase